MVCSKYQSLLPKSRLEELIQRADFFIGLYKTSSLLDSREKHITDEIKMVFAYAIANTIPEEQLRPDYIVASVFNPNVAVNISKLLSIL